MKKRYDVGTFPELCIIAGAFASNFVFDGV
jgi:hypothetical protein